MTIWGKRTHSVAEHLQARVYACMHNADESRMAEPIEQKRVEGDLTMGGLPHGPQPYDT